MLRLVKLFYYFFKTHLLNTKQMKKTLLTIAAFLMLSIAAQAQEFKLGAQVGLLIPKLDLEKAQSSVNTQEFDGATGFQVGLAARLKFSTLYVQVEPTYSRIGGEVKLAKNSTSVSEKFNSSRFDLPVMIGARFGIGEVFGVRINAGPMASFYLNNTSLQDDLKQAYQKINDTAQSVESDDFDAKNFQFAYQAGVGVDVTKFSLDVRYEGSFGDYLEGTGTAKELGLSGLSTSQFVVKLGYFFK
jgi:opacity protein-like surface antigen